MEIISAGDLHILPKQTKRTEIGAELSEAAVKAILRNEFKFQGDALVTLPFSTLNAVVLPLPRIFTSS